MVVLSLEQRLKEIKDRCDAATPGPWKLHRVVNKLKDHEFIAHARQDIPMLLEIINMLYTEPEFSETGEHLYSRIDKMLEKYK